MRKLFLISAVMLASVSAHAGQSRGLLLAANDTPEAAAAAPAPTPQAVQTQSGSAQAQPQAQAAPAQPPADAPKQHVSRPVKKAHAHHWESDEAKARRIAARYGISW